MIMRGDDLISYGQGWHDAMKAKRKRQNKRDIIWFFPAYATITAILVAVAFYTSGPIYSAISWLLTEKPAECVGGATSVELPFGFWTPQSCDQWGHVGRKS